MRMIRLKVDEKIPVLRGPVKGELIAVHCPYCNHLHFHDWTPEMNYSHVYAACDDVTGIHSPLKETGYLIALEVKNKFRWH